MKAMEKGNTRDLIIDPSFSDIKIDTTSILSFSMRNERIVLITEDFEAKAYGNNTDGILSLSLPREYLQEFTQFDIKDNEGCIWYPISAAICLKSTLYLVSKFKRGYKKMLVYNGTKTKSNLPIFLNIGDSNPVAIFNSLDDNYVVIDSEGRIIFIHNSNTKLNGKLIHSINLPNGEKAVSAACGMFKCYVLSSIGNLFEFNFFIKKNKIVFKQVKELKNIKITQISGISSHFLALTEDGRVFSCGNNSNGEACQQDEYVENFRQILFFNNSFIKAVYAGYIYSFFQKNNGQILACGSNMNNQCLVQSEIREIKTPTPIKTNINGNIDFCIITYNYNALFVGFEPEMCANKKITHEIRIGLFGGKKKTMISQLFISNKYDANNFIEQKYDEYSVNVEINHEPLKITLIDSSKYDNDLEKRMLYYQRAPNLLFFIDISDESALEKLKIFFDEANKACSGDFKLAVVAYGGKSYSENQEIKIDTSKYNYIRKMYKCEVFEIKTRYDAQIYRPFYHFIETNINKSDIYKVGYEHRNPFLDINNEHINIGIFGDSNVEKTDFAFRIIFDELYEHFYEDFKTNFTDIELTKLIEIDNKIQYLSIIDSSLAKAISDSYYSMVQGIIFVFSIDLIISSPDYIDTIKKEYNKAKESIKGELIFEIGLKVDKNKQDLKIHQKDESKIDEIEEQFNCPVFLFSTETGENIEDMIYYLTKKINKHRKQTSKMKKKDRKRKHKKKKFGNINK